MIMLKLYNCRSNNYALSITNLYKRVIKLSVSREDITNGAKAALKEKGWRKRNFSWTKKCDGEIILVINLQGSQFDKNTFYVNTGIYIIPLGNKAVPSIADCHMRQRINSPVNSPGLFVGIADKFDEWYGSSEKTRKKYSENKLLEFNDKRIFSYFSGL